VDPGAHVTPADRWPVPFVLRSLETGRVHQLLAFTKVGRSRTHLDPQIDLVIDGPASADVSRLHAVVKVWQLPDSTQWNLRIYPLHSQGLYGAGSGHGPGGGHSGGGTSVQSVKASPQIIDRLNSGTITRSEYFRQSCVEQHIGSEIAPGSIIRFGIHEMWMVDRCALFQRCQLAAVAMGATKSLVSEDPTEVRHLVVPNAAAHHALQGCRKWFDLMRVVLEWLGEPDEPPCVESIEVQDELRNPISRHVALTLEEQDSYDVMKILSDVRIGTTIRLKLCSDPRLLAPVLQHLDDHRAKMDKIFLGREDIPD